MSSTLLLLDDNESLLEIMGRVMETVFNRPVVKAKRLAEIAEREEAALACGLAFLDINLGPNEPNGIDVYHWLQERGFRGQIYFLTGHAQSNPLLEQACSLGAVKVLPKPISLDCLKEVLVGHP
ncbi:MAG: response regulator [Bdellovibrionota bacterium]